MPVWCVCKQREWTGPFEPVSLPSSPERQAPEERLLFFIPKLCYNQYKNGIETGGRAE